MVNLSGNRRGLVFAVIWSASTLSLGWLLWEGAYTFNSPALIPALLILLVCTGGLLWWLGGSVPEYPSGLPQTRRARFALAIALVIVILFPLRTLVGPALLFGLPVVGAGVLLIMRPHLTQQEAGYALLLALVAGTAGLGAQWVTIQPVIWAGLQVALVLTGLLAGWAILRHTGLLQAGFGEPLLLTSGGRQALRGLLLGILIAVPWGIGLVVMGSASGENWVQHWWQPVIAIQPAIGEEAWGRVLLVPLMYVVLRRAAKPRTALTAAVIVTAYWFAFLHTPGGIEDIFSMLMIGTLFAIPTSYVWLRGGLETAIGFHFWMDFFKFAAAYILNNNIIS